MPNEADRAMGPDRRTRAMSVHRLLTVVFAWITAFLIKLVCGANRLTTTREDIFAAGIKQGGNIFVFWHDRLFYLAHYYVKRSCGHKVTMLVSLSRDGDYGVALVRRLKQEVVRGSSSRGGYRAVSELVRRLRQGENVAITPDGPRGPAFKVNEGTIRLAQITGARIIPASFDASRKRRLNSWDRFIMVKPLGRVHVAFGEPMEIPSGISAAERKSYCKQLEQRLCQLNRFCAAQVSSGTSPMARSAERPGSKTLPAGTELRPSQTSVKRS